MGYRMICSAVASLVTILAWGCASHADGFSRAQKDEIGAVVKEYLLKNPEVVRDAMTELNRRRKAQAQAAVLASPHHAVVGAADGSATLVEFFDYNCGYCKRALGDIANLMKSDPKLKVVLADFPILSDGSVEAAVVEAALRKQFTGDKFWQFHQRLLSSRGAVGQAEALAVAKSLGADMARLDKDMADPAVKAGIKETMKIAQSLEINGTPSFLIGQDVLAGAVGYDELKAKVANTRTCGKATC